MEKEIRALYIEGLAAHDDPEPCVDVREDVAEALDRGTCRPGH